MTAICCEHFMTSIGSLRCQPLARSCTLASRLISSLLEPSFSMFTTSGTSLSPTHVVSEAPPHPKEQDTQLVKYSIDGKEASVVTTFLDKSSQLLWIKPVQPNSSVLALDLLQLKVRKSS